MLGKLAQSGQALYCKAVFLVLKPELFDMGKLMLLLSHWKQCLWEWQLRSPLLGEDHSPTETLAPATQRLGILLNYNNSMIASESCGNFCIMLSDIHTQWRPLSVSRMVWYCEDAPVSNVSQALLHRRIIWGEKLHLHQKSKSLDVGVRHEIFKIFPDEFSVEPNEQV